MAWVAPVISGIASLAGGAMENSGASAANRASQRSQDIAWDRELWASNTAMQRKVADLRQAGLNPMLAYQQGGSSTPATSGVRYENEGMGSARALAQIANTVSQSALLKDQKELLDAQTAAAGSSAAQSAATAAQINQNVQWLQDTWNSRMEQQDLNLLYDRTRNHMQGMDDNVKLATWKFIIDQMQIETEKLGYGRDIARYEREAFKNQAEFERSEIGKMKRTADAILDTIGNATSIVNPFIRRDRQPTETTTTIQRDSRGREVGRDTYTR